MTAYEDVHEEWIEHGTIDGDQPADLGLNTQPDQLEYIERIYGPQRPAWASTDRDLP